jgi:8-oxo-dGTP pyrophosphatase MutT (NUDIX family)
MAAGILLINKGKMMFICEERNHTAKYNFIGGKRECRLDSLTMPRLESAIETAASEFEEETGYELPKREYDKVFWFPQSKYLLFIINGTNPRKSGNTKWFTTSQIQQGLKEGIFHDYITDSLSFVLEYL